jgi:hypothetical protein
MKTAHAYNSAIGFNQIRVLFDFFFSGFESGSFLMVILNLRRNTSIQIFSLHYKCLIE